MRPMPSQEEFDAMHDAAFCDWWDAWVEAAQQQAVSEEEVEEADRVRHEAFEKRWEPVA